MGTINPNGHRRIARINKQLQREISLLLGERIKKETVKDAIITGVECARDLERARVFFTALDFRRRPALLEELQSVGGVLRTLLGQSMRLRQIPALEFVMDESADYGERIDGILSRLGLDSTPASRDEDGVELDEEEDDD
ncbi:MAG: 30S ribosome-binding factor RbfA [Fretibacterium sp.]|nr:30S ribosome-binding factor RbfA [Fretibacterium sp.]